MRPVSSYLFTLLFALVAANFLGACSDDATTPDSGAKDGGKSDGAKSDGSTSDGAPADGGGGLCGQKTVNLEDNVNPGSFAATLCFDPSAPSCSIVSGEACAGPFIGKWFRSDPSTFVFAAVWPGAKLQDPTAGTISNGNELGGFSLDQDLAVTIVFEPTAGNEMRVRVPFTMSQNSVKVGSVTQL